MKFKSGTRRRALEYEKDIIRYWKDNNTFEKSIEQRPVTDSYVFYDGPPFITGVPHHGTLLSSIVKDAVPRYQTMKGKRVERVWGWDTHGLPAENFIEKKLGITSRHEVGEKISLADYITTARESMVSNAALWEDTIDRIGRWVDFKGAYRTMDKDYMESVWWAFKELYEKGKIYEGERVLMYDTQWATPLSKAEVTMDAGAYIDVTDPSVYVKFPLTKESYRNFSERIGFITDPEEDKTVSILAWTTTPWTLPANTALAVNKDVNYMTAKVGDEVLIVAVDLADTIFTDEKHALIEYQEMNRFRGGDLVGLEYEPLFEDRGEKGHRVWSADYVTTDSGTGIVHLAPAYGEEDFIFAKEKHIPVVHVLDEYGIYTEGVWKGEEVWSINKSIAKTLLEQGVVWKIDYIRHEYPHNPRTGHRLMYRAHPSWFFNIDEQRTLMLEENAQHINWFPPHIKHGRFEKTIETAPDWNVSRDRFWATAMPVWKGTDKDGNEKVKVVGSYAELKELSGRELEDYHRPWVDEIEFDLDGVHYTRIEKVLDGWFESGSMPFAQFHYPFENTEKFEANFPGDFIVEYVGQVRAWFYYVHAVNVGLFGHNAFKNVIVTGTVAGNDGKKMSKSVGNYTDPNELMDQYSADSLRFTLLSNPLLAGEDFSLKDKEVGDVARKLSMVWNMYDFFTLYAEVDGWEFTPSADGVIADPSESLTNPLDQWIVSRLHQLIEEIETNMDGYDIPNAVKPILTFIDDASNWFVRRSRRRFWKSEDDADKNDAYRTLHYVLVRVSQALAPFVPFLSEELYRNLTGEESVHLTNWPKVGHINEPVVSDMDTVRDYVTQALSLRAASKMKIRQPLASVTVPTLGKAINFEDILTEELNVKKVIQGGEKVELDLDITPELKREGYAREIIRYIQAARKTADLNVDDHIDLSLSTEDEDLAQTIKEFGTVIADETLAGAISTGEYAYVETAMIEGKTLQLSLQKN
ncbi:MAG: isoleucine--tRNA ligase [Candidatus Microsaccharimonas sossegonensis]|uniref:Isoleucine--tRNA ligase n=1 Tax=Candidatus Microsaccharimonas sossegonensis TaxID=2506948 RepID=A0A4Q0AHA8_9BACT|nr:MAG: isoleucine--tRNA ligase [Candidatus Microsaccharimonas sossegonensis]